MNFANKSVSFKNYVMLIGYTICKSSQNNWLYHLFHSSKYKNMTINAWYQHQRPIFLHLFTLCLKIHAIIKMHHQSTEWKPSQAKEMEQPLNKNYILTCNLQQSVWVRIWLQYNFSIQVVFLTYSSDYLYSDNW